MKALVVARLYWATVWKQASLTTVLYWILRLAVAGIEIGHGMAGIAGNPLWIHYFAVVGIAPSVASQLIPLVGLLDITFGMLMLFHPLRGVLLWLTVWGTWTALLRPLAGEGVWECVERAGNFGVPLAFLLLCGWPNTFKEWIIAEARPRLKLAKAHWFSWILRVTTASLLVGHAGLLLTAHQSLWISQFALFGQTKQEALTLLPWFAWFEIVLGMMVLVKPIPGMLFFICIWKIAVEILRPLTGDTIWAVLERSGSYAAPLVLCLLLARLQWASRQQPGFIHEHITKENRPMADKDLDITIDLNNLAETSMSWGKDAEAEPLLKQARTIQGKEG